MRAEMQIAAYEARITSRGRTISAQNVALAGPGAKLLGIKGEFPDGWQPMIKACHREFEPETEEIAVRSWSMKTLSRHEIAKRAKARNSAGSQLRSKIRTSSAPAETENFQTNPRTQGSNPQK